MEAMELLPLAGDRVRTCGGGRGRETRVAEDSCVERSGCGGKEGHGRVDVLHLQLTGKALPSTDRTVMEEGRAGLRLKKRKHMQRN